MVDSRQKGARAEGQAKELLRKLTKLNWQRTPQSGALDKLHGLKGDLYIPNEKNVFCAEVKHYKDDNFTSKLLTGKNPTVIDWWKQTLREADEVNREPLLLFKFDRSKWFVATNIEPSDSSYRYFYYSHAGQYSFYVALLEDWIKVEEPIFVL